MKKTKFYVCPCCGSFILGMGNSQILCCGKQLEQLRAKKIDDEHKIKISEIEDEFFIEFNHEMTKEHYISFVSMLSSTEFLLFACILNKMRLFYFLKSMEVKFIFIALKMDYLNIKY